MFPKYDQQKVTIEIGKDYFTKKEIPVMHTNYSKSNGYSGCMLVSPILNVKYGQSGNANLHAVEQAIYSLDCDANLKDDKEKKEAERFFKWLKTMIHNMKVVAFRDTDAFHYHRMKAARRSDGDDDGFGRFCRDCYVSVLKKDNKSNLYNAGLYKLS